MSHRDDSVSQGDLGRLCDLIYAQSGIKLSPDKKVMIEGRLKRRLRELNLGTYAEYCRHLFAGKGQDREQEIVHLIDVITTNKTDFFREGAHFDFLVQKALPDLRASGPSGREFRFWSAGCSTGEEPYTLAMVLAQYGESHPGFKFKVLATDISNTVLATAKMGVFSSEVIRPVASELRRKYFMRSRDPNSNQLRVVPELRERIEFRRLNLMEEFGMSELMDGIFCRNVIIYFDRPTQERLLAKLSRQLAGGGYMFVGHSETLHDMDLPLVPVAPALYKKAMDR
jgi:chemotaxis protein methyltransferase CheR